MDINGQIVKMLRQTRGWTQQYLSDACGVSLRTIQRVEKDSTASHDTLAGLCAVLEVEQESLLTGIGQTSALPERQSRYQLMGAVGVGAVLGSVLTLLLVR